MSSRNNYSIARLFGNLKVRLKLIVLHNLFFLVLTCAAYFSLIPQFEQQAIERARAAALSGKAQETEVANVVFRARVTLFVVLGVIYVAAVVLLEAAIMPLYVFRPIRLLLEADQATRAGDRARELIPASEIPDDEIGQIMRSRNETVAALRRREDELAAALRRLEEQDRLVSLGLLSASVAHELNTPLAVLHGSVEQLIESAKTSSSDPQMLERLARIERVTQRLRAISESLLDFAKVRTQTTEPVAVRELIEEAWALVAIDQRAGGVQFHNAVAADERVLGNPDRLVQVFVNLLRNALYAVESPGGQIQVSSRPLWRGNTAGLAIAIEDNGRGIPPEVLPDIFDAFVTARLDAHGTGLGLTVAHGIVTQHGGTITASNRPEGGARLEVWLPAAANAS